MERRAFLARTGVAAGAAWAAPAVLSVQAAAAQTAPPVPPTFAAIDGIEGGPGANTLDVPVPPGLFSVGDYLLAVVTVRFSASKDSGALPPAGWTPVVPSTFPPVGTPGGVISQTPTNPTVALRGFVFGYFYNGEASFTFTKTVDNGSPSYWSISLVGYSGVNTTTPIDAAAGQGQVGTSVTAPSITTTAADTTVVYLGGSFTDGTWTAPAGYTFRAEGPSTGTNPDGYVADLVPGAPGATGPATATLATSQDNVGFLVGLRGA